MKKIAVFFTCIILIALFALLVRYGVRHSRGVPVTDKELEKQTLAVPFIDKDIDLSKGISDDVWKGIEPKNVEMMYQATVLPWPRKLVSSLSVKAFHNKDSIYFYLEWPDDTENRTVEVDKFSDACAVMFPLGDKVQPASIMMGFLGKANIWQWKASLDNEYWYDTYPHMVTYTDFYYPFEEEELINVTKSNFKSAAVDLLAVRVGTVTPKPNQNVSGRGFYSDGKWRVVFRRSLDTLDFETSASFASGKKKQSVFAVWNGENKDRGGRKSISEWVELEIE